MYVVVNVAAVTVLRRVPEFDVRLVTALALRFAMHTNEREVGQVVIEGHRVELHDVGVSPFVIGMTAETGAAAGLPVETVKALL